LGEINITVSTILPVYSVKDQPGLYLPGPPGAHPSRGARRGDRLFDARGPARRPSPWRFAPVPPPKQPG